MTLFAGMPDSWRCIDCGFDTAPGNQTGPEIKTIYDSRAIRASEEICTYNITNECEIYNVRNKVWKRAGMQSEGGCLCIGCLEKRIRRRLKPEDFPHSHPLNGLPGTERLCARRGR